MNKWSDKVFYYDKGHHQRQQALSAVVSYKRALAIDPQKDNAAYDYLGTLLYEQKSYTRAEKFFQRAYIRMSYIPEISCYWGLCLLKIKKYKQAAEQFRIVIADPFYSPARAPCELGKALFHQHLYHEALEVLEKDALKNPLDQAVNAQYQKALFYVGDFDKALETATRNLKKSYWENSSTNNIRGLLFLIEGCEEEAIKYFEKAVNSNKEETYAWVNWSMVLLQQGDKRKALEILKKGIDFIEEGVNVKDEIEEIIGHYKHVSYMLEKKILQASDEKAKISLEKTSGMMKLIIGYLENPNFENMIEAIFKEEVEEKKDENREREISDYFGTIDDPSINNNDILHNIGPILNDQLEENEFERLESKTPNEAEGNPEQNEDHSEMINDSQIEKSNRPDMLNSIDSLSNDEADEFEEKKLKRSENRTSNENEGSYVQNKDLSIEKNKKFGILMKYDFIVAGIFLIISIFIFYKVNLST